MEEAGVPGENHQGAEKFFLSRQVEVKLVLRHFLT